MNHLRERFTLVPFFELGNCKDVVHHSSGSPYFAPSGKALFTDPVIVAVRANIVDSNFPPSSFLATSCNTRPYHSYGPVIRQVFEKMEPHKYGEVRRALEGVMEVGEIRKIAPGNLYEEAEQILLGCVSPMTGNTNMEIIQEVIQGFASVFSHSSWGSTFRMPVIGTGKARKGKASEEIFRQIIQMILSSFTPHLLPPSPKKGPKKLLLFHPFEYESIMMAKVLMEKALFMTLLDKMAIRNDSSLVFAIAHGEKKENQILEGTHFDEALDYFDLAVEKLLKGDSKGALENSAKGALKEPGLRGMYFYISSFVDKPNGLIDSFIQESFLLAKNGKVKEASYLVKGMENLESSSREKVFFQSIHKSYIHSAIGQMEANLLYENYSETEELLTNILNNNPLNDPSPFQYLQEKIPSRILSNSFHIIIRKLMSEQVEVEGAKRAVENLLEMEEHKKIKINTENHHIIKKLLELLDFIKIQKNNLSKKALRESILEKLEKLLPNHSTFFLESARYYLNPSFSKEKTSFSKIDLGKAWKYLEQALQKHPRDYGILSYMGFLILLQGKKTLPLAEEFYTLFQKLLEDEILYGCFSPFYLESRNGKKIPLPNLDISAQMAYQYYKTYKKNTENLLDFSKALIQGEGRESIGLYKKILLSFESIGRYDLTELYEEILGESWVILLCRPNLSMGSISIPFCGEISLDFLALFYRKIRYWWKYRKLKSKEMETAIQDFVHKLGTKLSIH